MTTLIRQPVRRRRRTAATRYEPIDAVHNDVLDCDEFFLTIGNDAGETIRPRLEIADVKTFAAFRRALKKRLAVSPWDLRWESRLDVPGAIPR